MHKIVMNVMITLASFGFLYFVSSMEVAVFSLFYGENNRFTGGKLWFTKKIANTEDVEAFFLTLRTFFLGAYAFFFYQLAINVGLTPDYLPYAIAFIGLFGFSTVFAMIILPSQAVVWSKDTVLGAWLAIFMLYYIFYPATFVIKHAVDFFLRKLSLDGIKILATQKQLAFVADDSGTVLDEDEKRMIRHIVDLGDQTVFEAMIPRVDVICATVDAKPQDIIALIKIHKHSRIPVFKDSLDNIVGVLYAKDLLLSYGTNQLPVDMFRLCRKAYFVPESKLLKELLDEFRIMKIHIAIVVDEYGGFSGIVTLEDIIEEIIGEINDEYDIEEQSVIKLDDNAWRTVGKMPIDELEDLLDIKLPNTEAGTLGGLILERFGAIPKPGCSIDLTDDITLHVEQVSAQRIRSVKIIRHHR